MWTDPYLRFKLLEVGALEEEERTPPTAPNVKKASWEGTALVLDLPKGSPRPPLVAVMLWDAELHAADDAHASADVRVEAGPGAARGTHTARLDGRKPFKGVSVSFDFEMTDVGVDVDSDDEAEAAPQGMVVEELP